MGRFVLAWALFGVGHAIWWCFDRKWCGGMRWGTYGAYSTCMVWSDGIQGSGDGPWSLLADEVVVRPKP